MTSTIKQMWPNGKGGNIAVKCIFIITGLPHDFSHHTGPTHFCFHPCRNPHKLGLHFRGIPVYSCPHDVARKIWNGYFPAEISRVQQVCNGFLENPTRTLQIYHLFLIGIAHRLCHTFSLVVACSRTDWVNVAPVQLGLRMFLWICTQAIMCAFEATTSD